MKKIYLNILALLFISGCSENIQVEYDVEFPQKKTYEWRLVTAWPKNYPGLGMAPERIANLVEEMSDGQMKITVYGAGEQVPAFGVFDAVSSGSHQMGHSGGYFWKGKAPAAQFFTGVPFGLTADEINAWTNRGGGLELWREVYAPFNIYPIPAGNTGTQMFGWFNKEINSLDDIKGLKMRIPGIGGEVLKRAGGIPVTLPGGNYLLRCKQALLMQLNGLVHITTLLLVFNKLLNIIIILDGMSQAPC
jgi:TRAP-type mannitol/chloroaromatic compound transport system substrate-binding protein